MFEIIFLVVLCIYFFLSVVFIIGVKKRFPQLSENELPFVSVIVAARNEENNIRECLQSLDKLIYPENKLEMIIADDASIDKTSPIIDEFIKERKNFRSFRITENGDEKLKGKIRAVAKAIKAANGEIILTTDADCEVNPLWAKTIASYYKDDVGVVNGFTSQKVSGWFSGIQGLDLIYLLFVASGSINIGRPVSCIGNNMSFRKKAYEDAGGFENLPFSVTEDFMLLNAIKKTGKYKIIYPLDGHSLILSKPCNNLKELFRQKKRWAVGGIRTPTFGIFVMAAAFLTNLSLLLTPLFFSSAWLYLAVFKIGVDLFVLLPVHQKFSLTKNLKYFPVYEIYYILYVTMLPLILLFNRKVVWKGREY